MHSIFIHWWFFLVGLLFILWILHFCYRFWHLIMPSCLLRKKRKRRKIWLLLLLHRNPNPTHQRTEKRKEKKYYTTSSEKSNSFKLLYLFLYQHMCFSCVNSPSTPKKKKIEGAFPNAWVGNLFIIFNFSNWLQKHQINRPTWNIVYRASISVKGL